jgi:hypothetical protein
MSIVVDLGVRAACCVPAPLFGLNRNVRELLILHHELSHDRMEMRWLSPSALWKRLLELIAASQGHELLDDILSTAADRARNTDDVRGVVGAVSGATQAVFGVATAADEG